MSWLGKFQARLLYKLLPIIGSKANHLSCRLYYCVARYPPRVVATPRPPVLQVSLHDNDMVDGKFKIATDWYITLLYWIEANLSCRFH